VRNLAELRELVSRFAGAVEEFALGDSSAPLRELSVGRQVRDAISPETI
jgi:hypothetical protein